MQEAGVWAIENMYMVSAEYGPRYNFDILKRWAKYSNTI